MESKAIIEVSDLKKQYHEGDAPAVNGISFSIRENEIFGLLGPNGAGKTTTISMMCGLVKATSGNIRMMGQDLQTSFRDLKMHLGIVPQDIALYPSLTGRENLEFYGAMYGVEKGILRQRIAQWLEKMEMGSSADRRVESYSGGMKRRINLIAGILHEPKVLFLDEPTVGVDVQSRSTIIAHLRELNAQGMTVIYTSHHLEEAEKFCTEVAIIDQGALLAQGDAQSLVQAHNCSDLEGLFLKLTHKAQRN